MALSVLSLDEALDSFTKTFHSAFIQGIESNSAAVLLPRFWRLLP